MLLEVGRGGGSDVIRMLQSPWLPIQHWRRGKMNELFCLCRSHMAASVGSIRLFDQSKEDW